jgi:hypothetical protein
MKRNRDDNGNSKLMQFMEDAELQIKAEQKAETFKRRVAYILTKYPSAKGDDNQLVYYYWRTYHPEVRITMSQFEQLMSLTRAESIVRFRRWINEKGVLIDGSLQFFRPTPETTSKRRAMAGRVERVMVGAGI